MRVYLASLGCKLNQGEIEALGRWLAGLGYVIVREPEEAELIVLNTCTVTHVAERKSRHQIQRLRREYPRARLVVTGCYAHMTPDLPADLVVDNLRKDELAKLIWQTWPPRSSEPASPPRRRTRAMVKIQDGCDNACTYCIVHIARGPQRSRPLEQVLDEVRERVAEGYREVVLTGVHVGAYGRDLGLSLVQLVRRILDEIDVERLRLSSIEPWDFDPALIPLWEDPRLCRHLHLPLQSGCDATLRRMNRRYTTAQFAALVERLRAEVPAMAITTDLIVGFPGETEEEFQQTVRFVERMAFARIHVFPYSPREGTPAATMEGQVPPSVKKERAAVIREIGLRSGERFRRRFLGETLEVLWEIRDRRGRWSGLTDNYIRVFAHASQQLHNLIIPTRLTALEGQGVIGIPLLEDSGGGSSSDST